MTQVRKAIIPVAGFGTRLLPISKAIPKEMVPVVDRPLIQHVIEEALAAGINEIILVTRSGKSAIEDHFDAHVELEDALASKGKDALLATLAAIAPPELKITSVRQANAKGLGHAVFCAAHLLGKDEPFAVILPDVLVKPQPGSTTCDLGRWWRFGTPAAPRKLWWKPCLRKMFIVMVLLTVMSPAPVKARICAAWSRNPSPKTRLHGCRSLAGIFCRIGLWSFYATSRLALVMKFS